MIDYLILGLLVTWFAIDVFNLRPKRAEEESGVEEILEDLVAEIREIPADVSAKLAAVIQSLKKSPTKIDPELKPEEPKVEAPPKVAKKAAPVSALPELKKQYQEWKKKGGSKTLGLTVKFMKKGDVTFEETTLRGTDEIDKFIKKAEREGYIVQ